MRCNPGRFGRVTVLSLGVPWAIKGVGKAGAGRESEGSAATRCGDVRRTAVASAAVRGRPARAQAATGHRVAGGEGAVSGDRGHARQPGNSRTESDLEARRG